MTKKVLTRDTNYILYCPLAIFCMCSRQQFPSHRLGIMFPQQTDAFLKLGPFTATGFYFIPSCHLKLTSTFRHTSNSRTTLL